MGDYVIYMIIAVSLAALTRLVHEIRARLEQRDELRLLQHLADTRGAKAAIEMAHARRPQTRSRRIPQLPRRRAPDGPVGCQNSGLGR